MAEGFSYELDFTDLQDVEERLGSLRRKAPATVAQAINRVLRDQKRQLAKDVRAILNLKLRSVNSRLAVRRASVSNPAGEIIASEDKPPNLTSFSGARWARTKGVVVKVRKGQPVETHERAFIRSGRGGTRLVLRRKYESGVLAPRPKSGGPITEHRRRYPLTAVQGPSPVGLLMGRPGFAEQQLDAMGDELEVEIDNAIAAQFARASRRRRR